MSGWARVRAVSGRRGWARVRGSTRELGTTPPLPLIPALSLLTGRYWCGLDIVMSTRSKAGSDHGTGLLDCRTAAKYSYGYESRRLPSRSSALRVASLVEVVPPVPPVVPPGSGVTGGTTVIWSGCWEWRGCQGRLAVVCALLVGVADLKQHFIGEGPSEQVDPDG